MPDGRGFTDTIGTISGLAREEHATLLIRYEGKSQIVSLPRGSACSIGRAQPSDVVIQSTRLSRQHARFTYAEAGLLVEDLDSRNGTFVEGRRVSSALLHSGDSLCLGDVVVSAHIFQPPKSGLSGLLSHGRFLTLLEAEAVRTQTLRSRAALLLVGVKPGRGLEPLVSLARSLLRQSDALSLYAPQIVEILLTEVGGDVVRVREIAERLVQAGASCGGADLPGSASAPHDLLNQAKLALDASLASGKAVFHVEPQEEVTPATDIVAESPPMRKLFALVERVAASPVPVLIQGETGTGKEVVARALHTRSSRARGPLKILNCGALSPQLVESQLFGHERGAFTGAEKLRKGLFEEANGGTLFLDEIGELPPSAQAALLRALENKTITRVGGSQEIEVDVRVIAASHRRLDAMCEEGTFREDLYFRLNVMTLFVPPLRDHPDDVLPLARTFLRRAARLQNVRPPELGPAVEEALTEYGWPGNVRELRNEMERALVVSDGPLIELEDLSDRLRDGVRSLPISTPTRPNDDGSDRETVAPLADQGGPLRSLRERVSDFEREEIKKALEECGGNQTLAAEHLDVPRRTLVHKIRLHRIKASGDP